MQRPTTKHELLAIIDKELSPVAATQALAASHAQVVALIESLNEAELFTPGHYGWLGKATLEASIRANTYNHYRWATKLIRQWQPEKKTRRQEAADK